MTVLLSITSKEDMSPSASPRNCGAKIAKRAAEGGLVQLYIRRQLKPPYRILQRFLVASKGLQVN